MWFRGRKKRSKDKTLKANTYRDNVYIRGERKNQKTKKTRKKITEKTES
jgi:hypothetical protein